MHYCDHKLSVFRPTVVVTFSHFRLLLWNRCQICCFFADLKNKMAPWPLIGWDIFDFFSETADRNSTKLDRKQYLNVLYQVCGFFFRADRKNEMSSDWPRHFRLLLWNRRTEFNRSRQDARYQRPPLSSVCFSDRSDKQDGHPGLWLAETFFNSPWKPVIGFQRDLAGS